MNVDAAGTTYPPVTFVVEPERVAAFRASFGIDSGVPPTFPTAAEFTVLPGVLDDPRLGLDFTRVVHGTQGYEYVRPLREGESLEVRTRIESIRQRGGTGFMTIATDLVDETGETVCTARSQMIERAADG